MREIKFRAWDKTSREMLFNIDNMNTRHRHNFNQMNQMIGRYVLMQFTGLSDKNGVEIYEGDVVRTKSGIIATIEYETQAAQYWIKWGDDKASRYNVITATDSGMNCSYIEVIGNIYENPDLL